MGRSSQLGYFSSKGQRLLCGQLHSADIVFSRPYLSNGRAVIMVVVHCSSVHRGYIVANQCEIGLGCYWSLIESFKWHVNYWPWMTLKVLRAFFDGKMAMYLRNITI